MRPEKKDINLSLSILTASGALEVAVMGISDSLALLVSRSYDYINAVPAPLIMS